MEKKGQQTPSVFHNCNFRTTNNGSSNIFLDTIPPNPSSTEQFASNTDSQQQQQYILLQPTTSTIDDLFQVIQQPINFDDMSIIEQQLKSLSNNNNTEQTNQMYNNMMNSSQFVRNSGTQPQNNNQHFDSNNIYENLFDELEGFDQQQNQMMTPNNGQNYYNVPTFTIPNHNTIITSSTPGLHHMGQQPFVMTNVSPNANHLFANNSPNKNQNPFMTSQQFMHYAIQTNQAYAPKQSTTEQFANTVSHLNSLPLSPPDSSSNSGLSNTLMTTPSPQAVSLSFNFTGVQVPDLIKLVEGFNKPVKEKQIGGRDNTRHALSRQVVELDITKLPPNSNPSVISVRPVVMGVDRITRKSNRLSVLNEKPFVKIASQPLERWVVVFDDIIIQFASHNNGQKLSLKFELLDAEKQVVCSIDSYGFETITKRGLEKIKERRKAKDKRKRGSDSEDEEDQNDVSVEHVTPAFGLTSGGTLVKVVGTGFASTPVSKCVVRFGDKDAREIHSVKRNCIVCETPESDKTGLVDVHVTMGEEVLQSNAKFQYIDPNNPSDLQIMIQHMLGNQSSPNSNQGGNDPSAFSNKCYDQSLFYSGKVTDECGFTVLHHASTRGLFELCQYLVANSVCPIDAKDNFGRTALHWAAYASEELVALYLLNNGADICTKDEMGDTLLHIACRYSTVEFVQNLMSVLLKYDDKYRTNTSNIATMLATTNIDGETPLDLVKKMEQNDEVLELLSTLEQLSEACTSRLSEYRIHDLKDIILRSGEFNGKSMSKLEGDSFTLTFNLQLKKDQLVLLIDSSGSQIRASIDYKQIAFLILVKNQLRAEITLTSKPCIEIKDQNGNWAVLNDHQYLSSCLSFHLEVHDASALDKINKFICDNDLLYPFQTMCFCFRAPIENTIGDKKETIAKSPLNTNVDKLSDINFTKIPISPTTSPIMTNNLNLIQ